MKNLDVETHFNRKYRQFDSFYNQKKGLVARLIDNTFRKSMRLRFEKVIHSIEPYKDKTVLDIGCGAGRYSLALAHQGVKLAYGIDFAPNMIAEARQQAQQQKVDEICRFQRADFMTMDLDQTYHHAFAMGVMDYIEAPVAFVRKAMQVSNVSVMLSFPSAGGPVQWGRKHYFFKIKKCPVYFYRRQDIQRIAKEAGAKEFTIEKLAKDYFLTIQLTK